MACLLLTIFFLPLLFGLATCNLLQVNEERGGDLTRATATPSGNGIWGAGGLTLAAPKHTIHPEKRNGDISALSPATATPTRNDIFGPGGLWGTIKPSVLAEKRDGEGEPLSTVDLSLPLATPVFTPGPSLANPHTHTIHRIHPHHSVNTTATWSTYTLSGSPIGGSTKEGVISTLPPFTDTFGPFQHLPTPAVGDIVPKTQGTDEVQYTPRSHPWHSPSIMDHDAVMTSFKADVITSYPPLPTVISNSLAPDCATTFWQLQSPYQTGRTKTVFTSTKTEETSIYCQGGCTNLVVSTKPMGYSSDHWFRHTKTISSIATQINIVGCIPTSHTWATPTPTS